MEERGIIMGELYDKYILCKSSRVAATELVNDICDGKLRRNELNEIIDELESNSKFNKADFPEYPKENWNKKYLEQLNCEVIGGAFSKKYLLYILDVREYLDEKGKKVKIFKALSIIGIAIIIIVILIFILSLCKKG